MLCDSTNNLGCFCKAASGSRSSTALKHRGRCKCFGLTVIHLLSLENCYIKNLSLQFFVVLVFFHPPTSTSDKLSLGSLCSYQLALINDLFPRLYELSLGCLQCSVDKTTCKTIYYVQGPLTHTECEVPSGHLNKDMTGLTAGEVWTQHCGTHTVTYLQNMQCSGHFFHIFHCSALNFTVFCPFPSSSVLRRCHPSAIFARHLFGQRRGARTRHLALHLADALP